MPWAGSPQNGKKEDFRRETKRGKEKVPQVRRKTRQRSKDNGSNTSPLRTTSRHCNNVAGKSKRVSSKRGFKREARTTKGQRPLQRVTSRRRGAGGGTKSERTEKVFKTMGIRHHVGDRKFASRRADKLVNTLQGQGKKKRTQT